jgi:copper chaperone CopZ
MDTEEIYIEDETWEDIRKEAEQTGRDPNEIAEEFKKFLAELRAEVDEDPKIIEIRRIISSYVDKKDYKTAV